MGTCSIRPASQVASSASCGPFVKALAAATLTPQAGKTMVLAMLLQHPESLKASCFMWLPEQRQLCALPR